MDLKNNLLGVLDVGLCDNQEVYNDYLERLEKGDLTRDEEAETHFCVYFLPYNSATKEVFIVHHKKSGKWLSPGGHIDKGEVLFEALNREIDEELGMKNFFNEAPKPFLFTVTHIEKNPVRPCKTHYDTWYLVPTDGSNFKIDPTEFFDTKWLTIDEARKLVIDGPNLSALRRVESL